MRKLIFLFAAIAGTVVFTGCQGPEQKLSRGLDNTFELVRWGDMRRSVEQEAVFSAPNTSYTYGAVHGFDQSIKRAGLGILETVTFFVPNPHSADNWDYKTPCWTNSIPVTPQYPESYRPGLISSSTFDTDTYTGFSGGDVAPFIPGSRFEIFDN
jgi:putative exosortase-associated protein (TIGR04073 family)